MDSGQCGLPSTPRRSRRGSYFGTGARHTLPAARTWRDSPRSNRFRRTPSRYHEGRRSHAPRRSGGRPQRNPGSYWRDSSARQLTGSPFAPHAEPRFPSVSPPDEWSGDGHLTEPPRIPVVVSPNSRERTFTEIMNGAFDLKKSPTCLGKRLAGHTARDGEDWKLQSPFGVHCSSPENSSSDWSTPTRKRKAASQLGPIVKQVKSMHGPDTQMSSSDSYLVSNSINIPAVGNQTDSVTVGLTMPSQPVPAQSPELAKLLEMVQQNTQQSRELVDLVTSYINRHSADLQETAPVTGDLGSHLSKEVTNKMQSDLPPQSSALACGGDSPDPPGDPRDTFRGHMIDRIDVISKSPRKTPEPSCDCERGHRSASQLSPLEGGSPNIKLEDDSDYLAVPEPWASSLPYRMGALELRAAAGDREDLTRAPHVSSEATVGTQGQSCRWRNCSAPSPESQNTCYLGCGIQPIVNLFLDGTESSVGGKTPTRVCNSPGVEPKVAIITSPEGSDWSIDIQSPSQDRANGSPRDLTTGDDTEHCQGGQGKSSYLEVVAEENRGSDIAERNPANTCAGDEPNSHRDSPDHSDTTCPVNFLPLTMTTQRPIPIRARENCHPESLCWHPDCSDTSSGSRSRVSQTRGSIGRGDGEPRPWKL